jgi:hypothetical protein
MTQDDPNRGWSNPIGTFHRLQIAVRILASHESPRKMRIDEATSALMDLIPQYFPKAIRERAERVLSVREKLRRGHDSNVGSFPFDLLKPKECAALIRDILSLYEACIFDMSKEIKEIAHPDEK